MEADNLRQHNAAILGPAAGMLPGLTSQLEVDGAAYAIVGDGLCIHPCIDDEAGAGLEIVWLAMLVDRVEGVEQGGGRRLRGRVAGTRCGGRGGRVDGHA